jgi:hypothetical protein
MNAPTYWRTNALPQADRLTSALNALRSIANSVAEGRSSAPQLGGQWKHETRLVVREQGAPRLRESGAAILADWSDSSDPPEISTNLDGWHGVIKCQGFRIVLTDAADGGAALGLYLGGALDDPLGDPITFDEITPKFTD